METRFNLKEIFAAAASHQAYARAYFHRLGELMQTVDLDIIGQIVQIFEAARQAHKCIYFLANGGSAAVSSHWATDLAIGAYQESAPNFRAFCLTRNVESLTAIGNDHSFDDIFIRQLKSNMVADDVVVAFSASGNSENVIRAMQWAGDNGAITIGISGFDGARLRTMCTVNLHIPTTKDEYGPAEDLFAILGHLISSYLTMQRGKNLYR